MENDQDQWYLVNEKARTNAVIIKSEKKKRIIKREQERSVVVQRKNGITAG